MKYNDCSLECSLNIQIVQFFLNVMWTLKFHFGICKHYVDITFERSMNILKQIVTF